LNLDRYFCRLMDIKMLRVWCSAVFLLTALSGFSQKRSDSNTGADKPLFSVDGKDVTTSEFLYLFRKNNQSKAEATEASVKEYLDLVINFKLKVAEAQFRGIDTTQSFV
jgi:peptidyl-prolyl cis-trans isomerase SurA